MQNGIIVGVNTSLSEKEFLYDMEELKSLAEACEIEIVDSVTQNLDKIFDRTYVGKGKLEEIKVAINCHDADVVIFNDELSPSQISNLEKVLEIKIYDRTFLILEIFKRRAKTKEAILQVDIASLRYMLPRLSSLRSGFSRQRGNGGAFHGKGQGETQLEIDRRNIGSRISLLKEELKNCTNQRTIQRKRRKDNNIPSISLVGYTNSGKSSTLNALLDSSISTKKTVMEKNMLFATLETATRLVKLPSNKEFLLTDTVGFVNKLPHELVEAFKSTLEEIKESDLILHVVDATNENFENQIKITNDVLKELGANDIPTIYVFNKIDLVDNYLYIPPVYSNAVRISAKTKENITELLEKIDEELFKKYRTATFNIPFSRGDLVSMLNENSQVINVEYNDFTIITANVSERIYNLLKEYEKKAL